MDSSPRSSALEVKEAGLSTAQRVPPCFARDDRFRKIEDLFQSLANTALSSRPTQLLRAAQQLASGGTCFSLTLMPPPTPSTLQRSCDHLPARLSEFPQ